MNVTCSFTTKILGGLTHSYSYKLAKCPLPLFE
jgi:hypothetical protein